MPARPPTSYPVIISYSTATLALTTELSQRSWCTGTSSQSSAGKWLRVLKAMLSGFALETELKRSQRNLQGKSSITTITNLRKTCQLVTSNLKPYQAYQASFQSEWCTSSWYSTARIRFCSIQFIGRMMLAAAEAGQANTTRSKVSTSPWSSCFVVSQCQLWGLNGLDEFWKGLHSEMDPLKFTSSQSVSQASGNNLLLPKARFFAELHLPEAHKQ